MNFIQQAYKGANDFWRYFIGFFILLFGWQFIGIIPLLITAVFHSKDTATFMKAAQTNFMNLGINSNLYLVLMLLTFAAGLGTLFIIVKGIHKRSITSLITSRSTIDWKRFFFAFGLWFFITILMLVFGYFSDPENFTWNFKPVPFLILVLVSFVLMPIQTSFEELLFNFCLQRQ